MTETTMMAGTFNAPTLQEQLRKLGLGGAFLCPYCAEQADIDARFCNHCKKRFKEPLGIPVAERLRLIAKTEILEEIENSFILHSFCPAHEGPCECWKNFKMRQLKPSWESTEGLRAAPAAN